ncbi:MAG TPA: hypothetical protein VFB27_14810 [Opitutaceae bacterium]|nr:hypothetical protein [Opitutaceae bacterium]
MIDQVPPETWRKAVDVAREQAVEMDNDYTAWPPFSGDDEEDIE